MRNVFVTALVMLGFVSASLSAQAGWDPTKNEKEVKAAQETIAAFKQKDPSISKFLDKAEGYVVFPKIGKGGFIVGGAHGKGIVYEKGAVIGHASMTQGTIGAQIGGQTFSEIIFFGTKEALDHFKQNKLEFAAQATAVAAKEGAAANADYSKGVAIFTMAKAGLMAEAAIGGQKFTFEPTAKK
jgi:lipid-binding SYLF domain-containing protein